MSVLELLGIIRLTFRQAEGRRVKNAVLCLKYIFLLLATAVTVWLGLHAHGTTAKSVFVIGAVAAALITFLRRGILAREMCLLSESFLRTSEGETIPAPAFPALLSGEIVYLAAKWTVLTAMLTPAFLCLRYGIIYYSLSSDRRNFMLLLASSLLLAASGTIFAAVLSARLSCAEYLWISGRCAGMPSALECSWALTRGSGGEVLRLCFLSFFCGLTVSFLCKVRLSQKLLRQKGLPSPVGLHLEIARDRCGKQRLEIA